MNPHVKLLLTAFAVASFGSLFATEFAVGSLFAANNEENMEGADVVKGLKKYSCLRVGTLTVCNNETINGNLAVGGNETIGGNLSVGGNETVGGDLTVTGSICGSAVVLCPAAAAGTVGVPGIGGVLAYGEVGSVVGDTGASVTIAAGSAAPATFSYAGPLSGITAHTTSGTIDGLVLGSAGTYLFQYEVSNLTEVAVFNNEIALTSNGTQIPNSKFGTIGVVGTELSTGQINGFILSNQPAGALIQLVNPGLSVVTTGTETGTVNAKITALRVA